MSDEPLNQAIDEVARETTAASAPEAAAFRRRVMARIERGDAPRRAWPASFVLTPIAAATAIAIAMLAVREPKNVAPAPDVLHTARTEPAGRVTAEPPSRRPSPIGPEASGRGVPEVAPRTAARSAAPRTAPAVPPALDADAVASIVVAPLVVDTQTPPSIAVAPLEAVAPMTISPLEISDCQRRFE